MDGKQEETALREFTIHDSYLVDSTLRLRRIEEAGNPIVYKLGQKIRVGNDFQFHIAHTTLYISEQEFEALAALPTRKLEKKRSIFPLEDMQFALDEFEGELSGLTLIEIDLGQRDVTHAPLPFENLVEVTNDERFTGGELVKLNSDSLTTLLSEYGVK